MAYDFLTWSDVPPFPADPAKPPLILDISVSKLPSYYIDAIKPLVYDGLLTMACIGQDRLISYQELDKVLGTGIGLGDPWSASCLPSSALLSRPMMLCPVRR